MGGGCDLAHAIATGPTPFTAPLPLLWPLPIQLCPSLPRSALPSADLPAPVDSRRASDAGGRVPAFLPASLSALF